MRAFPGKRTERCTTSNCTARKLPPVFVRSILPVELAHHQDKLAQNRGRQLPKAARGNKVSSGCKTAEKSSVLSAKQEDIHCLDLLTDEVGLLQLEMVMNSSLYKQMSEQYSCMKKLHSSIRRQLTDEIADESRTVQAQRGELRRLKRLRGTLSEQVRRLDEQLNQMQLDNYQKRCQLLAQQGYNPYESAMDIIADSMSYENMLALEEQMGNVSRGLADNQLAKLPQKQLEVDQDDKCCICYEDLLKGERVTVLACSHTHHSACLKKWVKLKKQCPICRQELIVQS